MKGKLRTSQEFAGRRATVGDAVLVMTSEDHLVPGQVHHITDETAAPGYRDRVFVVYAVDNAWSKDPLLCFEPLHFHDGAPEEMPPGYWCWPVEER